MSDDDAFGHWLAGFVAGEGSFIICRAKASAYRVWFSLHVRGDEAAIVDEILQRTGLGAAYPRPGRGNTNPMLMWKVEKRAEVLGLVALFDRYPLRAKKAREFAIWREAALLWCDMRPQRSSAPRRQPDGSLAGSAVANDWSAIQRLHDELRIIRAFASPGLRPV